MNQINYKKISVLIFFVIVISYIYYYVSPINADYQPLADTDYSLEISNVSKSNQWSTFKKSDNNSFFIHPGINKFVVGIFKINKKTKLKFDFYIRTGSKSGKIAFLVWKNSSMEPNLKIGEKHRFFVNPNLSHKIEFNVKKGDRIIVIADKYGDTAQDWGGLKILAKDNYELYKSYFVLLLWLSLFVVLFIKKYTNLFLVNYLLFCSFIFADKLNFNGLPFNLLILYSCYGFAITFFSVIFYQYLNKKLSFVLSFVAYISLFSVSLFVITYNLNFDKNITKDIIYAILQTNTSEAYEYVNGFIEIQYVLMFVFIFLFSTVALFLQHKRSVLKFDNLLLIFIVIVFTILSGLQWNSFRLPKFIFEGISDYYSELKLFKQIQKKRKSGKIIFDAYKKNKSETYIVVIGESLNRRHMGLYGYFRNTTPNLSELDKKQKLLVFDNAYSHHTHTVPVLSFSLTEANQYNDKNYFESLSILDVLNKAGFETYWLTNQAIYGAWDNAVSVIAKTAKHVVSINKTIGTKTVTQKYDGALIGELKKILKKKSEKNRVIFIHLMGSHAEYDQRYPNDNFTVFNGKLDQGIFGKKAAKNEKINYYDNSVVYNDYVVSSFLKELMKIKGVSAFMYFSDHSDDIVRNLGHDSGQFTYEMIQIPLIFWFSEDYKKRYFKTYNILKNHIHSIFTNDLIYDSLIGLFGIQTEKLGQKFDISSDNYSLTEENALIFKKIHFNNKNNYIYWQKKNTSFLLDIKQDSRIFPHRIDSVGKLNDVWNDGFRSFELDIRFGDNNSDKFVVGHNPGDMGILLEDYLNTVDYKDIKRMWFDFKNLTANNHKKALEELERLDKKFGLKAKIILESGTTKEFFKIFREKGWHTSYYLPTGTIINLLKENNREKMEKLSTKIAKQTGFQNVSAVSFDFRLYPFVKDYLEPKVSDSIVYHIWYAPEMFNPDFKNSLINNELFKNKRIKTLLSVYKSLYNL